MALADQLDYDWDVLADQLGPLHLPREYCPIEPNVKQEWFLRRDELEVFFGGSAGPGKSWGLLMAALQYVDHPGYHALLLRPSLTEFEQPGGLIEVSDNWLGTSDAFWHGSKRSWTFPSGATIRFGYLSNTGDLRQYKGPSYSFCGFDELTGFRETLYRGMFRVLRQAKGRLDDVPLRMRSASNPGDVGHGWVKSYFIEEASRNKGAVFVPATIQDNPDLDYDAYLKSLSHMSPIDQMRLINGDWDVMEEGGKFNREDFNVIDTHEMERSVKAVRYWDLAATEPSATNTDPDYTVGLRLDKDAAGKFTIRDIVRGRWSEDVVERKVRQTATEDGRGVDVYIEQEPGASGKSLLGYYKRQVLQGYVCYSGLVNSGNKEVRSRPAAAAVANGLVSIVRGENLIPFLDEASMFPNGEHDDCVDAFSGAHTAITRSTGRVSVAGPRGRIETIDRARDGSSTYGYAG